MKSLILTTKCNHNIKTELCTILKDLSAIFHSCSSLPMTPYLSIYNHPKLRQSLIKSGCKNMNAFGLRYITETVNMEQGIVCFVPTSMHSPPGFANRRFDRASNQCTADGDMGAQESRRPMPRLRCYSYSHS